MKHLIFYSLILGILSLFFACERPKAEEPSYPTDLQGKKALLAAKKNEARELDKFMAQLEEEIEALDPTIKNLKKVTTSTIDQENIKRFVEIQGSIVADDIVIASSEVGGRLLSLNVDEGDYIQRGQKIASVDMESVRKQIAEVEKSLELATEVYTRQNRLWQQNIGSEIQFLEAKNNKERLEKSLETIRYGLSKGEVYAPSSGVVEQVMINAGEMASPGAPILQILNVNKVKVSIDVPEKYLKKVQKGSKIKIEIPTLEYEKIVRVTDIGRMIDPGNRTFKVEANISSNGGKIKPNLMAIAHIVDYEIDNAFAIDTELIQQDIDGSTYVFIVETDEEGKNIIDKRFIETGESIDNRLIVTSGLTGSEILVQEGARLVNAGQEVIIENEEANDGTSE